MGCGNFNKVVNMKNFYITTAIDYANGSPHLGHAYEKIISDVIARTQRLQGVPVTFLTGLDEHGQKVQQSAEAQGIEPQKFCDQVADSFKQMCRDLQISNTDYIRTTEKRHKDVVNSILQNLYDRGEIYKKDYRGFYSIRAEQFLQEKDKVDGFWPDAYGEVVEILEPNYFFKLSNYQEWLIKYIEDYPEFIFPRFRTAQVLEFLKEPINDLCLSRPKERLQWGIPLPFDSEFVTYVWFDALINYISAVGYGSESFEEHWPADLHVIGKDILQPPHAVYWPIMLKAIGVSMPKRLLVHGFWTLQGEKMSKSKGNVLNPLDIAKEFGSDAFRYFVVREMNLGQDSNFSRELFLSRYKGELANDLGNLLSRILHMVNQYCNGIIPCPELVAQPEEDLHNLWQTTVRSVLNHYKKFEFHVGLENVFIFIKSINRYAEVRQPWMLAKSKEPNARSELNTALFYMTEGLRLSNCLFAAVMPETTEKIQNILGLDVFSTWDKELDWDQRIVGKTVSKKTILFPRPS